jgi:hypothetical protein
MNQVDESARLPGGPGVAAFLSAGIAVFALSLAAVVGDHSAVFRKAMILYLPTGPLSGVTTTAVVVWVVSWIALHLRWRQSNPKGWTMTLGIGLAVAGFLLMVPAVADLF